MLLPEKMGHTKTTPCVKILEWVARQLHDKFQQLEDGVHMTFLR